MKSLWTMLLPATLVVGSAAAQTVPDLLQRNPAVNPDRINEEQRRRLEERAEPQLTQPTKPGVEGPPPAEPTAGGQGEVRFLMRGVRFTHSDYLAQADLDALTAPLIGREVSLAELRGVVDAVNRLYAARDLTTARAILPTQDIQDGVVQIRLVEGRIGKVSVDRANPRSDAYLRRRGAIEAGALASPDAIAGRLKLFNLNNDAQLRARLAPGGELGQTDLVLVAEEPRRIGIDAFTDNYGFASTGRQEVGGVLRAYRVLGPADRLTGVFVASRGVRSGNLSLSTPLGDRFRIGASASYGRTHILFGDLAALDVRGTSASFGADAAALLLVDDRFTVSATAAVQTTRSRTRISGRQVIRNDLITPSIGLAASYLAPGFAFSIQHQLAVPTVRERVSGDELTPLLFQGSATAAKSVPGGTLVRLRADWQLSSADRLPGVLQYQIGGPRSSRAFEQGSAAGDDGLLASIEIARPLRTNTMQIEPFVFVDYAQASQQGGLSSFQSAGLGVALTSTPFVTARATVAHGIGARGFADAGTRAFFSMTLRR